MGLHTQRLEYTPVTQGVKTELMFQKISPSDLLAGGVLTTLATLVMDWLEVLLLKDMCVWVGVGGG